MLYDLDALEAEAENLHLAVATHRKLLAEAEANGDPEAGAIRVHLAAIESEAGEAKRKFDLAKMLEENRLTGVFIPAPEAHHAI